MARSRIARRFALVEFRCDQHISARENGPGNGMLTIHRGKWAFCPSSRTHGHRWVATGGVKIGELVHLAPRT